MPASARDNFAQAAKDSGLTLSAYMGQLGRQVWRERAYAEERAAWLEDIKDRQFMAQLAQWEELSGDPASAS